MKERKEFGKSKRKKVYHVQGRVKKAISRFQEETL
jgi:hypothetical protein